jgi:type VI protein secretion system component Hcp
MFNAPIIASTKPKNATRCSVLHRIGLLIVAITVVLAGPCFADDSLLSFTVTVASDPTCTFRGMSLETKVTQTITNKFGSETDVSSLVVTKNTDACSPKLYELVAKGTTVPTVVVSLRANINGTNQEVRRIILSNVVPTSIMFDNVVEHVAFVYQAITIRDSTSDTDTTDRKQK